MVRGWHYSKLSLSSALLLSFSGMCILLLFLSFCRFIFILLLLGLCRRSSDLFLSSRPRTGLATTYITGYFKKNHIEARSVLISTVLLSTFVLSVLQAVFMFLKKNQNASRLSEHPPVRGKNCQNV